jgi:hypothetical protein
VTLRLIGKREIIIFLLAGGVLFSLNVRLELPFLVLEGSRSIVFVSCFSFEGLLASCST